MSYSNTGTRRRDFLRKGVFAGLAGILGIKLTPDLSGAPAIKTNGAKPVAIASRNGLAAVEKAYEIIAQGRAATA